MAWREYNRRISKASSVRWLSTRRYSTQFRAHEKVLSTPK
jgi:hypothetical protein